MSRLGIRPAPEKATLTWFTFVGLLAATILVSSTCGPATSNQGGGEVMSGTAEWPGSFAIGRDATPSEIAALDIDFGPVYM